ncbi:MAG: leucine-rich repeat protein [Ruminococcus sp.]
MKAIRIISVVLSLVIVCSAFTGFTAFAVETDTEGSAKDIKTVGDNANTKSVSPKTSGTTGDCVWKYNSTSKTLTISGNGEMEDYDEDVYSPWHEYHNIIEKVVIENGVTKIGNYAFDLCVKLLNVNIPSSVTSIGAGAFFYCDSLSNIVIPDGVVSIGVSAFENCESLKSIIIPNSVTELGSSAFSDCKKLSGVTIGDSVTEIRRDLFSRCTSLTKVKMGKMVSRIGWCAFEFCERLSSITLPDSLIFIERDAFRRSGCYNKHPNGVVYIDKWVIGYKGTMPQKTIIELKDGVVGIAESAFLEQNNLVGIKIPNSVTVICDKAFEKCKGLKDAKIPNSVTTIGMYAFRYCRSLMDITIPDSVVEIGTYAFYYTAYFNKQPDGVIYKNNWAIGYKGDMPQNTSITLRYGIKHLVNNFLSSKRNLMEIEIPDTVESIGREAFMCCTGLYKIKIPNSVTRIEYEAFCDCTSLLSVTIGRNVKSIEERAFFDCKNLFSITIPDNVTEIGELAFGYYSSYNSYYGRYDDKSITYFTIYGNGNSKAQEYAKKNNFSYVILTGERKNQMVIIDKADYYITMDEPLTLYASASTTHTFVSLDRDVVEISRNGIVKTTGDGTATIIIGAKETKEYNFAFATMKVTVSKGTQEITNVRPQYIKTANSGFTVHPMAKTRLTYTSSNKSVATVYSNGEIIVNKGGYAYITITAIDNWGYYSSEFRTKIISAPRNFSSKDVSKVKKISKTKAKITWKSLAGASGYTVQYATNKSFKGAKTVKCSKKTATLTKLKKGKTYYVRVNAYTKVSGKKYANKWYKKKFKM